MWEFLKNLCQDPKLSYNLMIIQIPVVICLSFQCFQAYKLKFNGFAFVTIGWIINFCYLLFTALTVKFDLDNHIKLLVRTSFDAFCMFFFLQAGLTHEWDDQSASKNKNQLLLFLKKYRNVCLRSKRGAFY